MTDAEWKAAWLAFERKGGAHGDIAKMLLFTTQRLREVADMRWSEVNFDTGVCTLPGARAKNKRENQISLSEAALKVLTSRKRIAGSGYVFTVSGRKLGSSFTKAKRAFDKAMAETLGAPPAPWVLHDLRRTAASGMAGLGIALHIVEAVLNHKGGSIKGVEAVYNRYFYAAEKRAALEAWARYVAAIVDGGDIWLRHLKETNNERARERFNAAIVAGGDAWACYLDTIVSGSSTPSNVVEIGARRAALVEHI